MQSLPNKSYSKAGKALKSTVFLFILFSGILPFSIKAEAHTSSMENATDSLALPAPQLSTFSKETSAVGDTTTGDSLPFEELDLLIIETQKQLDDLSAKLSDLSLLLNMNEIPAKNKKTTLENIKNMQEVIQVLSAQFFSPKKDVTRNRNPRIILSLLHINHVISKHLLSSLTKQKSFVLLPLSSAAIEEALMSFERLIKRGTTIESILSHMRELAEKNKMLLKKISDATYSAGLRWYNKIYRHLDRFFIGPSVRHAYSALLAATLFLYAGHGWQKLYPGSFDVLKGNSFTKHIYSLYGERPQFFSRLDEEGRLVGGTDCANHNRVGIINKLVMFVEANPLLVASSGGILAWMGPRWLEKWKKEMWPSIKKRASILHNKLLGGAYLNKAKQEEETVEQIFFDDLVGLEEAKSEFTKLIHYLVNPELLNLMKITPTKGILLVGETRTGKSYCVKAFFNEAKKALKKAGRTNFKLVVLSAFEIQMAGIERITAQLKESAPCIAFIDEIDLLALQRSANSTLLSEFLQCMSGALNNNDPKKQVIIIAATNKPEHLDSALRQFGRFGKEIRFEYPTKEHRLQYVRKKLDKLSLDHGLFDADRIAQETDGMSYEALNTLFSSALFMARIRGGSLTQRDIDEAFDTELRRKMHQNKTISPKEKTIAATYFGGKALLLSRCNDIPLSLAQVTIKPIMEGVDESIFWLEVMKTNKLQQKDAAKFQLGKVFTHHTGDTAQIYSRDEKIALCRYHLAGEAAEEMVFGSCGYSCESGKKHALPIALSLVCEGIEFAHIPKQAQKNYLKKAIELLDACKKEAREILEKHRSDLEKLSKELLVQETLSGKAVRTILEL